MKNNKHIKPMVVYWFSVSGLAEVPSSNKGEVQKQAEHSNDKKVASKRIQELSSDLFFSIFLKVSVL